MVTYLFLEFLSSFMTRLFGFPKTYRRLKGGSVWHSCSSCKYWPTEKFEEIEYNPQFGPVCVKIERRYAGF